MGFFNVPRCQHVKVNGTQCGSPAPQGEKLCFFHKRARHQRMRISMYPEDPFPFHVQVLEDGNAVQLAVMQLMQLLAMGRIDTKAAWAYLGCLQIASTNLARVNFEPHPQDMVIHPNQVKRTEIGGMCGGNVIKARRIHARMSFLKLGLIRG
jgi:hypothetical protein